MRRDVRDARDSGAGRAVRGLAGYRTQAALHANVLLRIVHPRVAAIAAARIRADAIGPATMQTT
ncbi:hypothetical protein [Burkholderia latens]|uniref:Uncharacterized protein n=1 Tax=Burkholderia latens TaxID=488446 RepID=A0A6H9TEG4_9BURK|nr:hypothetical protein [Burkholderia latens]KAB0643191.1 hypothetical protein F7R21_08435 [Burkholderia latens]VWB85818.1 hypothetical protein BLA24064_04059 [Burkholderia latens]